MKNLKKIALFCATMALTASCSQDFLEPEVKNYVTEEQKKELAKDPTVLQNMVTASLSASYNTLQQYWNSHDDFGLRAFQLATDMMTADLAYLRPSWFRYDYDFDNFGADYRRTNSTWNQWYDVIAKSNLILADYFAEETTDAAKLQAKAAPVGLRGVAFFHLANFYQVTYVGNEDKLGVPLPLKPEDEKLARSTLKETYQRIIEDLTFAVEHGVVTTKRTDVDRAVAAAYLAKAYASMEDWENVQKYAVIAQEGGSDEVLRFPPSWNVGNADVLWGFDVTPVTATLWASFYSHMDNTINFYAGRGQYKGIHNWLYAQMGPKDVRRTLFVNNADYPDIAKKVGFGNYVDKEGKVYDFDYISLKFTTKGKDEVNTDYIYIRVQDPILLEIEALVELNKLTDAANKLKAFMASRDADFVVASTQAELREQVRMQRRLELWGEGTTWFDLRRWKVLVDRTPGITGEETNHAVVLKKDLNDIENIHKLPQTEINNNKLLIQN